MSSYLKLLSKMFNKYPFMVKYHKVFSLIVLFTFFVLIFSSIAAAWGSDIYATPISGHYCGNGFVYGTATFPTYYPYEWWGCNDSPNYPEPICATADNEYKYCNWFEDFSTVDSVTTSFENGLCYIYPNDMCPEPSYMKYIQTIVCKSTPGGYSSQTFTNPTYNPFNWKGPSCGMPNNLYSICSTNSTASAFCSMTIMNNAIPYNNVGVIQSGSSGTCYNYISSDICPTSGYFPGPIASIACYNTLNCALAPCPAAATGSINMGCRSSGDTHSHSYNSTLNSPFNCITSGTYCYQCNPGYVWSGSACISASPPSAPSTPTCTPTGMTMMSISWNAVSGANNYTIQRNGASIQSGYINNIFYDSGLTAGSTYTYKIMACNSGGCSSWSNSCSGTTPYCSSSSDCSGNAYGNNYQCSGQTIQRQYLSYSCSSGSCIGPTNLWINQTTCANNCDSTCVNGQSTCYNTASGTDPYNLCSVGFTCNGQQIIDNSLCGAGTSCGAASTTCSGCTQCTSGQSTCQNIASGLDTNNYCTGGYTCNGQQIKDFNNCNGAGSCGANLTTCANNCDSVCVSGQASCVNTLPGTDPYNLCNGGFTCNGLTISVDNSVCGIGPSCGNITNCTAVPFGSNYYCDPNAGTTYGQCIKNLGFCDNNAFKCNDINQCTGDICNLPGQPLSYCTFPNNATGTDCGGLCQSCNGAGACINTDSTHDYQNECPGAFGVCANNFCNGAGACQFNSSASRCLTGSSWACFGAGSPNKCQLSRNNTLCSGSSFSCNGAISPETNNVAFGSVCTGGSTLPGNANTLYSYASANYCSGNNIVQNRTACDGSGGTQGPLLGVVTISTCSGATPYCVGAANCVQCLNDSNCASDGNPCTQEKCVFGTCTNNTPAVAGTVCRAQAGLCDIAENCTGASLACPPNIFRNNSKGSPSCGLCLGCFGTSAICQQVSNNADSFNECAASWDTCDSSCTRSGPGPNCNGVGNCSRQIGNTAYGNVCTGYGTSSPWSTTVYCDNSGPFCSARDYNDTFMSCSGSGTCSAYGIDVILLANDTVHCGTCDVNADCKGTPSTDCVGNSRRTFSPLCSGSPGTCSYPPTITACTGATPYCSSGICVACLNDSNCASDGNACSQDKCVAGACTYNTPAIAGTVCRAANGTCDRQENCTGASTACPADTVLNGNYCGTCQYCNGVSKTCVSMPNKTDNYSSCNGGFNCLGEIIVDNNNCNGLGACGANGITCANSCASKCVAGNSACQATASGNDTYNICSGNTSCYSFNQVQNNGLCSVSGTCGYITTCDVSIPYCVGAACVQCRNNSDCIGTCQQCNAGICQNAFNNTDPNNDCPSGACSANNCNGAGACQYNTSASRCSTGTWACFGAGSPNACQYSRNNTLCSGSSFNCNGATSPETNNILSGSVCSAGSPVAGNVNTLYSYASANYCSGNLIIQDRRACDGSGGTQGPLLGNVTITTCSGGTPYCSGAACVQCRNNTDCPTCQQCNAGACQNVANNQDPKNDCPGAFGICAGNNCNGAGACQFLTSTTSCRASAGVCDVQENCTGASYACGADTKMSASYQCRGQTGPCDNPSNCDGTNNACPPNNNRTGEKGNPSCGLCMGCFGTSATCQLIASGNDNFNECNASWDTCDSSCTRSGPGPNCNGAGACGRQTGNIAAGNVCTGAGLFSAWTTSIYCSNAGASCSGRNWVDTFMSCTGSGTCSSSGTNVTLTANDTIHCGTCTVAGDCSSIPSADCSDTTHRRTYGQSCTGSPGSCSYPPTITACTGATPYCSSGTCVACLINSDCADDGNPCTTELCNAAHACTHPAGNAGTVCRASGGACDPLETCTGASTSCPADIISNGNLCGTCQYCNGVSKTCTNVANNADTYNSCTGNCDACDGSGNCKATAGSCTGNCIQCIGGGTTYNCAANAGSCTGNCAQCTGGGTTYNCAANAGSCTGNCAQCTGGGTTYNCAANAGSCTGTSASCGCQGGGSLFACSICSTPSFCSSGACVGCTQNSDCNDNNPCTVDTCSLGSCSNVPGNAGTICNAAIPGGCDVAETCTGLSATCPADVKSPLGTNCGGTCQSCDGNGFCINTTGVDYQNECTDQWTNCTSFCTKTGTTDLCNGVGACQIKNANIAAGNICTGSGVEAALGCTAGTYCSAAANNCTGNNVTRTDYACNGAGSCTVSQALSCVLQNCGGTCNNVTKACDTGCGDGILQAGEECDLASNNGQGFGCDNSCHNTNCTITSVTITPAAGCTGNVCTTANQLSVSVGYFGSNCNLATFLQTDFISTDSACKILQSSGTLTGMNTLFNTASNPFIFTYTIPNIPDVCAAKNMTNTSTGLYNSSNTFLRVNSKYNNVQAGIILDQCRYFGSLATYATYYTIIQNNTQCIAYTCSNYDAKNVTIINGPQFGVQLFNTTSGAYDTHLCNATVSDSVCPDDFSNSGNCKALGICSIHAINDTDCNQQTQMQCGITYTPGAVPSCLVPTPTPHLGCSNNINCVYANELTGANPQCFGNGATTINKDNNTIVCRGASNIWCPNQYIYQGGRCVYNGTDCSTTICPYAATVAVTSSNVLTYLNKPSPAFQTNYISNSNCWTTTNGKRTQYCGLILSWPENRFGWLPVQVFYASQGIRYPENVNPAGQ